jgi:hypothetical protein
VSRALALTDGETARTACARGTLRCGVDEQTGELLPQAAVARRIAWCDQLVSAMVAGLTAARWNAADVAVLASGQDAAARKLPRVAWMALRRLTWTASAPEGLKVNDRIVRMAQELAGRSLRSAQWRAELTAGVLATWPADPDQRTREEWEAVRVAVPGGEHLPSSTIKGRTRQIAAFARKHGRMPADVFELEAAPPAARMLLLAACDRQQATIERHETESPAGAAAAAAPRPAGPGFLPGLDLGGLPISLPPTVPPAAVLHLPALRFQDGMARADLACTHAIPKVARTGHTVALGVDWGLNTLLSAGAARLHDDGRITTLGSGGMFRAAGVLAKQHRLRRLGERLQGRSDQYLRISDGRARRSLDAGTALEAKRDRLQGGICALSRRRPNLNDALAWSAARWTADQAIAAGATVIYVEDLRSMEARGMGRTMNTGMSQTVRGQIVERTRHIACEAGIAVVTVPARGTSKNCPRCLAVLRHCKAPGRPGTRGWKRARCVACGWQGDRDQGAWQRIAARGLAHQPKTVADRSSGAMVIRPVAGKLEATAIVAPQQASRKDRSKTGPTRRRSARPAPRRRRTPSPVRPSGLAGKRPEGRVHTGRLKLLRAADRYQGAHAISSPAARRHQPRGAALGAGFHLHAHASPSCWRPGPGLDATSGTGSLS